MAPFDGNPKAFDLSPVETQKPSEGDVFSLQGLIAWLLTQDLSTTYDWTKQQDCLLCRYSRASGFNDFSGFSNRGYYKNRAKDKFGNYLNFPVDSKVLRVAEAPFSAEGRISTYGEALERARALEAAARQRTGGV